MHFIYHQLTWNTNYSNFKGFTMSNMISNHQLILLVLKFLSDEDEVVKYLKGESFRMQYCMRIEYESTIYANAK